MRMKCDLKQHTGVTATAHYPRKWLNAFFRFWLFGKNFKNNNIFHLFQFTFFIFIFIIFLFFIYIVFCVGEFEIASQKKMNTYIPTMCNTIEKFITLIKPPTITIVLNKDLSYDHISGNEINKILEK